MEERVVVLETIQDRLVAIVEQSDARLDRIERVIWQAVGAISLIVLIANLIVPIILSKIGVTP